MVIISNNKKKLNIGKSKVIDKTKICKSLVIIFDKLSLETNPPEEIVVKAKFNPSKSLMFTKLYKKIINIVERK